MARIAFRAVYRSSFEAVGFIAPTNRRIASVVAFLQLVLHVDQVEIVHIETSERKGQHEPILFYYSLN